MKIHSITSIWPVLLAAVFLTGCRSSNRLSDFDYRDQTLGAVISVPPHPDVFTEDAFFLIGDHPLESVLRLGSRVLKEIEAEKVRARLDSALWQVDVAALMGKRILENGARLLDARPAASNEQADFLLDISVRAYGIDAQSWNSEARFLLDADVFLYEPSSGTDIWHDHFKETEPITPNLFGLGDIGVNILTAQALSELDIDEIITGFENLAYYASDRVLRRLRDDLNRSRR